MIVEILTTRLFMNNIYFMYLDIGLEHFDIPVHIHLNLSQAETLLIFYIIENSIRSNERLI